MRAADGQSLTVIAANVSADRTVPCTLRLEGFAAASVQGVRLSQDDVHAHPLLGRQEELVSPFEARVEKGATVRCDLPPKSAVFLRIAK
jgi:alpha-L-arabinofuranosidase